MRALPGTVGLGQVRYPTAGDAYSEEEAQPFYVNAPFGIVLVHNGNLTNASALKSELAEVDRRHINTTSDTEVLINVLAHELATASRDKPLTTDLIFEAIRAVHRRIRGSYAVVALIAGHGLLAFRDPYGIRPLCYGVKALTPDGGREVMVASESGGHRRHRPQGAARRRARRGDLHRSRRTRQRPAMCREPRQLNPCMFEYVYLARPDSIMDGISVYPGAAQHG